MGTSFGLSKLEALITIACEVPLAVWSVHRGTLKGGLLSFLLLCLTVTRLDGRRRNDASPSYLSFDEGDDVSRIVSEVKEK